MLCMETVAKIRRLHHKEGLSQRAIAEKLQLNRRTVNRYLSAVEPPKYSPRPPRYPKLGAFIPQLEQRLAAEPVACTPASGWEKGQVERQVGILRQKLFKPMLAFDGLESLNAYLEDRCRALMQVMMYPKDKGKTIAERLAEEQHALMPSAGEIPAM